MNELKTFLGDTDPIYRAMDSFLTEYTDTEGKPIFRSIERLNEDRQLFAEEMKKRDTRLVNKVLEIVNAKIQNMFSNELNGETLISKYELLDEIKEIVK